MTERPLCIFLLLFMGLIGVVRIADKNTEDKIYDGEQKKLVGQVVSIQGPGAEKSMTVRDVMEGDDYFCDKMIVRLKGEENPGARVGNLICITGKVYSFSRPGNPGQFDEYHYYRDAGIACRMAAQSVWIRDASYFWLQQRLCELRNSFFDKMLLCLPKSEAGTVAAMILGEKTELDEETKECYRAGGISHILAISGLHISMIGAGLFSFLRRFVMPMKLAALTTAVLLMVYGEMVGFPIATERAVIMMLCVLGARFLGRQYDIYCSLALSAAIQLAVHPMELFQAGFLLSYGTVLGISLWVKPVSDFFSVQIRGNKWKITLFSGIISSIGMQVFTLPILLYFYYEWNPYSFLVNLLILPLVGAMIAMSALAGTVAFFYVDAGRFFFGVVHMILKWNEIVCTLIQRLPFSDLILGRPAIWQIFLYYFILFLFLHGGVWGKDRMRFICRIGKIILPGLGFFVLLYRGPVSGLTITNLDIGQGDCACVRWKNHTILIDGGSSDVGSVGKYRIAPYLKYYGIQKIDAVYITHSDSDHTNGIQEIVEDNRYMGFKIDRVVLPGLEHRDPAYEQLENVCRERKILLDFLNAGDEYCIGSVRFSCLHPGKNYEWKSENDYSLVLSLCYRDFRALFTGDLEQTAEPELINRISDVDYLKVSHHGSKGASGEQFLNTASPEIAVISAGRKNRYGHPSQETLLRLEKIRAKVFCTIECGAVTTITDGETSSVTVYRQ